MTTSEASLERPGPAAHAAGGGGAEDVATMSIAELAGGWVGRRFEVSCAVKNMPVGDGVRTAATDLGVVEEGDGSAQGVPWDTDGQPAPPNGTIELPCNGIAKTFTIAAYSMHDANSGWWSPRRGEDFRAPVDVSLKASGSNFDDVRATVRIRLSDEGVPVAELR